MGEVRRDLREVQGDADGKYGNYEEREGDRVSFKLAVSKLATDRGRANPI